MARKKKTTYQADGNNSNKRQRSNPNQGGRTPASRKKKKTDQQEDLGSTDPVPVSQPTNNSQLWKAEVERVGFEFSKKSGRWDQIMSVIRMVGKECQYSEEDYIQLLNPMNNAECQRKKPENLNWDLSQVMKFSIQNGTIGVAHGIMKTEYNRIREQSLKRLDKGSVAGNLETMAKWRDLSDAWQQGAAYVTAFARTHPELSKQMAFRQSVDLAKKSYTTINSGRSMIEDLMQQRRLKMSYEAMERLFYQTKKVPHPKWPEDKEKNTQFVVCKTNAVEERAGDVICEFFDARGIAYPDKVDPPIPELRDWAINDGTANHPDDKDRFTTGVLDVWGNLLSIEESKDPPFEKPTEKQQLQLSYGCSDDAHFRFLVDPDGGDGQMIEGSDMPRFQDVDSFVEFLQERGFPEQWCMRSKRLKEHRKKSAINAMKEAQAHKTNTDTTPTQFVLGKNVTDLLTVVPTTVVRRFKRALDNREVEREIDPWYRWELPEDKQGIALLEAIIQTKLPNILEGIPGLDPTNEDPFQEIKDKYKEGFHKTKRYQYVFQLKDEYDECLKEFNFTPDTYSENINYSGGNWKQAWKMMLGCIGLHDKIKLAVKNLEVTYRTWMKRRPKLIRSATADARDSNGTPTEMPQYEPPGDKYRKAKNYLVGGLIGVAYSTAGYCDNLAFPQFNNDVELWIRRVNIACNVLGIHDAATMGETNVHYQAAIKTWIKPPFTAPFEWTMVMFTDYATKILKDKQDCSEAEKEFLVAYGKQLGRLSSSLSPVIKRALNAVKQAHREAYGDGDTTQEEEPAELLTQPTEADQGRNGTGNTTQETAANDDQDNERLPAQDTGTGTPTGTGNVIPVTPGTNHK